MQKEFETQILDIYVNDIIKKLRGLGAKETAEVLQKRWVFDIKPCTVESTGEWFRLRQVGEERSTTTYKNKSGKGLDETDEIEIEVDDFEKAAELLEKIDWNGKYYQENKRTIFKLKDIQFTIDKWPKIPVFLEIESTRKEGVAEGLKALGLEGKDAGHIGTIAIYKKYGIDLHSFKELKF